MSPTTTNARPRLKERYLTEIRPALQSELGLGNVMQVPRLEKIVLNCGVGRATQQQSLLDGAVTDLGDHHRARSRSSPGPRSRSPAFKLREGNAIGAKVTLRGDRMWEFYDRLVSVAIPRIRDFRGLNPNVVRRAWQLHVRRHRAADLPGDRLRQDRHRPRHGHHHRHHRRDRRRGPRARSQRARASRSAATSRAEVTAHGEEGTRPEAAAQAEVQGARLHPVPPVWPVALGVQALRPLPHLPARDGARRRGPRRDEGVVVRGMRGDAMMMTDPIADMLTRIRNANIAFHDDVAMPSSKLKEALARILEQEGYITGLRRERRLHAPRPPAHDHAEVHAGPQAHDLRHPARLEARAARVLEGDRRAARARRHGHLRSCPPTRVS